MKHLLALFIIVTSIYVTDSDDKSKSVVVIEYSDYTKDMVRIDRSKRYDSEYIWQVIDPIIERKTK